MKQKNRKQESGFDCACGGRCSGSCSEEHLSEQRRLQNSTSTLCPAAYKRNRKQGSGKRRKA